MWQNRIYALIIRRILGPYLTPKSKLNLQETLDISLRQGTVTLQSIELDGKVLTEKLISKTKNQDSDDDNVKNTKESSTQQSAKSNCSYDIEIKKVSIDELNISLFLVYDDEEKENSHDGEDDNNKHNNGGSSNSMGAKLVAKVELYGVHIQVELGSSTTTSPTLSACSKSGSNMTGGTSFSSQKMKHSSWKEEEEKDNSASLSSSSSSSSRSGFIQSYIQAALDSLKLTLDIQNLTIEIVSPTASTSTTTKSPSVNTTVQTKQPSYYSWIAIHLNSLSYKDSSLPPPPPSTSTSQDNEEDIYDKVGLTHEEQKNRIKSKVILGKEICFHQLWIDVGKGEGGNGSHVSQEILRFDGYATIIATIMKHMSCISNGKDSMERQLEIALDDMLDIQINPTALLIARDVLDAGAENKIGEEDSDKKSSAFHTSPRKQSTSREKGNEQTPRKSSFYVDEKDIIEDDDDDDQDVGLLAHILQQQQIESSSYLSSPQKIVETKTVEKDSSSLDVEGFFHTNQEGYSHYCKLASSIQMENQEDDVGIHIRTVDGSSDSMTTTISFYLKEMLVKVQLNKHCEENNLYEKQLSEIVASEGHDDGSIFLSTADVNAVMTQISNSEQTDLALDFNAFSVYYQQGANTASRDNLFQFIQCLDPKIESEKNASSESTCCGDLVASMKYSSWRQGDTKESDLHLTLNPILVTLRQEVILLFADSYKDLTKSDNRREESELSGNDSNSKPITSKEKKKLRLECSSISVEIPLELGASQNDDVSTSLGNLFRRSGYIFEFQNPVVSPTLAFTATEIEINVLTSNIESVEGDVELQLVLEKSILSLIALSDQSDGIKRCLKFDFLSIDSETQIDPDATVKIQYSNKPSLRSQPDAFKKQRAKSFFPSIVPLALVKASQQFNDDDNRGVGNRNGLNGSKRNIRGADPQSRMLKESSSCEKNLLIQVPNIAIDLNIDEKEALLNLMSMISSNNSNNTSRNDPKTTREKVENANETSNLIGVSFRCNQMIVSLHSNSNNQIDKKGGHYLQIVAFDGLHLYCLKNADGLRHIRFLTEDITLYEVEHIEKRQKDCSNLSEVADMCEMLRRRRFDRCNITQSNVIFFRTKLSHPLSPKTPAILVDLITKRQEDDFDDIERSLHISLYDITFRQNLDSCWVDRLKTFCAMQSDPNKADEEILNEHDETSKVTNIFCTVSDCNFDYSSPIHFNISSRTIARVGELRISSTLVSPQGPVQTCKVSIGDVSIHSSNKRGGYEEENARLSCSNLILQPEVVLLKKKSTVSHSYDDALFQLDFIAIASLDYLEGIVSVETENNSQQKPTAIPPTSDTTAAADSTLTLSIGKLCIFACKDSFEHFTGTINELILKLTMPSKEELDVMRKEYFGKNDRKDMSIQQTPGVEEINTISASSGNVFDEVPSLNDIVNDGLFSGKEMDESTSSYPPVEEETSTFYHVQEDVPDDSYGTGLDDSESGHEVIHDYYGYDSNHQGSSQHSSSSQDGDPTDCWTSIDHPWTDDPCIPNGQEQAAKWYSLDDSKADEEEIIPQLNPSSGTVIVEGKIPNERQPRIFNRHIPLSAISDPLAGGDMGASTFAGTKQVRVKMRILVTEMNFLCRLFDGYDWPAIITKPKDSNVKSKLLGDLMGGDDSPTLFSDEKEVSQVTEVKQRKCRQSERYFQFGFAGLKMRLDSLHPSEDHFLSSCLEIKVNNMNLIETVSSDKLVKLLGEWVNEDDHPRDSNDGLLMMKMVSLIPETKFAADGKLMGNEGHVVLELLPIRFFIHQIALRFIRQFFRSDDQESNEESGNNNPPNESDAENPPDMFFPTFKVKPFDIKVDYKPLEVDTTALKDGSYIQLLNLLPLEDMILRLNGVELRNLTGWGPVISELACKWLQDVSSTQMHKFLTRTTPLHPLANVGDGMKNFVLVPLKEYKQRGNVKKALRKSTSKLVGVVAYEALSVGAKLTGYAAKKLNKGKKKLLSSTSPSSSSADKSASSSFMMSPSLSTSTRASLSTTTSTTSKPISAIPRNIGDVSDRAIESLSRGLKEANAKIIIIPYREYQKTGTKGAMKKVVRGIPVAVCAPLSGAVEALSHGLYGASNSLRPDLFEEREASKRFHDEDL